MIVFMGVAGSGKSVQGKLLADDLRYRWFSLGQYLRTHISGERRQEMLAGKLLDDKEIIEILQSFFEGLGPDEACVLDGFPRTLAQAEWLINKHDTGKIKVDAIIHLKASREIVRHRLLERGRQDDTDEAINRRFKEYEESTLPIVEWFKGDKIPVYEINGERDIAVIHEDIIKLLATKK